MNPDVADGILNLELGKVHESNKAKLEEKTANLLAGNLSTRK